MSKINIIVACDHGGLNIKNKIKAILQRKGYLGELTDLGVQDDRSIDYPQVAERACLHLLNNTNEKQSAVLILACGTGIGISIAANKIKGIRCALVHDTYTAEMAKMHNHANCLAFGGRVNYKTSIESIIDSYFNTAESQDDRHLNRLSQVAVLEE